MGKTTKRKLNLTGRSGLIIKAVAALCILLLCVGAFFWFRESYRINDENIIVEGNIHYSREQIIEMVMDSRFSDNSVFLSWKYHDKSITDVPFVERIDVSVVDNHTVKITVYEKSLAGYVSYLGTYMYFDKDGIVVESSNILTPGIPEVSGLQFNHVVLHEPLPVENNEIFQEILNMTNLLNKYSISATKLQFDDFYDMTIYFNDVRVILGEEGDMDLKIMSLAQILPNLEGKSGVLHMESFSESNMNVTFEEDM